MNESLNKLTKDPSYAEHAYATFDYIKSLGNLHLHCNDHIDLILLIYFCSALNRSNFSR